jgi:hypothetical protein
MNALNTSKLTASNGWMTDEYEMERGRGLIWGTILFWRDWENHETLS